jgi:hypothetical protein
MADNEKMADQSSSQNSIGAVDVEKGASVETVKPVLDSQPATFPESKSTLRKWNDRIESLAGLEARGITRVLPEERHKAGLMQYMQVAFLWFSANLSVNNLLISLLGPLVLGLGFLDCALCALFGVLVGAATTAYMATWGPVSGNRTLVVARYFLGYWPSRIVGKSLVEFLMRTKSIQC